MRLIGQVIGIGQNTWSGKHGEKTDVFLTLLDTDAEDRYLNTVDYILSADETKKVPAKDSVVEICVKEMQPAFGGRFRLRGRILRTVSGK